MAGASVDKRRLSCLAVNTILEQIVRDQEKYTKLLDKLLQEVPAGDVSDCLHRINMTYSVTTLINKLTEVRDHIANHYEVAVRDIPGRSAQVDSGMGSSLMLQDPILPIEESEAQTSQRT